MGLAILGHGGDQDRLGLFQFPFHRDGPCDETFGPEGMISETFQFPFHRDGPCDEICCGLCNEDTPFQFPFHRDGPCDIICFNQNMEEIKLSVPFSSGWALRSRSSFSIGK